MEIRNPKSETRKNAAVNRRLRGFLVRNRHGSLQPLLEFTKLFVQRTVACFNVSRFNAFNDGIPFGSAAFWLAISCGALAADTNDVPQLGSLRPPRGELLPGFWEQYGAWVIFLSVLLVAAVGVAIWFVTRPKAIAPVPWFIQARRELEPLLQQTEDGALLSRISQILRRHIASAFELPLDEATTSEFSRALTQSEKVGPELSNELTELFRDCDFRKFASSVPPGPSRAAERALKLIERAEMRLAQWNAAATGSANTAAGVHNLPARAGNEA